MSYKGQCIVRGTYYGSPHMEGCPRYEPPSELDTLRRETAEKDRQIADLEARVEEIGTCANLFLEIVNHDLYAEDHSDEFVRLWGDLETALTLPTPGASDRLKEQHYRECAEIAKKLETGEESYYHRKASVAILQKLEGK